MSRAASRTAPIRIAHWLCFGGLLTLIFIPFSFAQRAELQMAVRHWQIHDGLPENNVQALTETEDGALWIGTSGGLVRFDGEEFRTFDQSNSTGFTDSNVTALLSSKRQLWVGTDSGVVVLNRGKMSHYPLAELASAPIHKFYSGQDDRIGAFTGEGVISWKDVNGTPTQVNASRSSQTLRTSPSRELPRPSLFTSSAEGVQIETILTTSDGTKWLSQAGVLFYKRLHNKKFLRYPHLRAEVTQLMLGSDGRLWVGTSHEGLWLIDHGVCNILLKEDPYRTLNIQALFEDDTHSIWVGTQAGLFQLILATTKLVRPPPAYPTELSTLALDSDGSVLVAGRHLYRIVNDHLVRVPLPGIGKAEVRNVVRDMHGNLWIGTVRDGLFRCSPHSVLHLSKRDGLANDSIRVMSEAPDGALWVGTDDGVSVVRNGKITSYGTAQGLADGLVQAVVSGHEGDMWFGTAHGLSHLKNGKFQHEPIVVQLSREKVWSMFSSPQGDVWIGTRSGGLYCWHNRKVLHFTTSQGLGSDSIYKILGSFRDALWLSGPGGVSLVSQRALLTQASSAGEISPVFFEISDGQETPNFYGGIQASGVISANGDVWFPTDHGPVYIPAAAGMPRHLRLQIKSVLVDGKEERNTAELYMNAGASTVQVHYGAVLLLPQSGVRYRYRLDKTDAAWTYAKGRSSANFAALPPGDFRFRVQAYDTSAPGDVVEAVLLIHKRPHFYRRPWFLLGCGIVLVLLSWSVHLFRIRTAQARLGAVYAERMRLSREVHDTVLQGCAGVSTLLEACSSTPPLHEQREMLIDHARTQIVSIMDDARDAIERFRSSGVADLEVSLALRKMLDRVQGEFGKEVEYTYSGSALTFPAAATHEIEMVAREALYNALIHSGGTRIRLHACAFKRELSITISDDGCGLTPDSSSKAGHYGLTGMRERVSMLNGRLQIKPAEPCGTVVEFCVPMPRVKRRGEA